MAPSQIDDMNEVSDSRTIGCVPVGSVNIQDRLGACQNTGNDRN